ncbi:MAG: hypothetical protein CL565_03425 [Alphaproteobacteria bacterium]|nr:hypothetical protein [Alphaproteobacteria bacterium]
MPPNKLRKNKNIPLSHPFDTNEMGAQKHVIIRPDEDELEKLSAFLDVKKITSAKGSFHLSRANGGNIVKVKGNVSAEITQECVVTLQELENTVGEDFEAYYTDYSQAVPFSAAKKSLFSKYGMSDIPVLDEEEDPEPMKNGVIDLGEVMLQFLSLGVDPYPHAANADEYLKEHGIQSADSVQEERSRKVDKGRKNPFEALRALKKDVDNEK